jgi:hypothetical protein
MHRSYFSDAFLPHTTYLIVSRLYFWLLPSLHIISCIKTNDLKSLKAWGNLFIFAYVLIYF